MTATIDNIAMSSAAESSIPYDPEAELVFGITCPIGVNYRPVLDCFKLYLEQFGYSYNEVKLSSEFDDLAIRLGIDAHHVSRSKLDIIRSKISLGNGIRERTGRQDVLALVAAAKIWSKRPDGSAPVPLAKTAHVIVSLKRPEEVETLRRLYGIGFFLVGIAPNESHRKTFFDEQGLEADVRTELVEVDSAENLEFGQRTRDTFYLSDVFISLGDFSDQVARFLDLVFGSPFHTPNMQERSMYLAYAASLTSSDLARQVGAALVDPNGDLLSVGWNDVPKPTGGLYGPESKPAPHRDTDLGEDSNDSEKMAMAVKILRKLDESVSEADAKKQAKDRLKGTGFFDITEFGRAVHAEMEALLACARSGRSTRGTSLYVTTFPCHNCTRHIIAAGVAKVFYIEPYAKSKALKLHDDAINDNQEQADDGRVPFLPFIGIGPRRYLDLFSMTLGTGYPVERKRSGKKIDWNRRKATPRLQMAPVSYLIREQIASYNLVKIISESQEKEARP